MFSIFSKKKEKEKKKRNNFDLNSKSKDILKSLFELPIDPNWLDEDKIEKINRDSTVTAAIARRKAATLKKEILITCDNEDILSNLEECFDFDTITSFLDTPYQGFSVFEVMWKEKEDGLFYPSCIERDYKDFSLKSKVLKYSLDGIDQDIPEYKAIYSVYAAKEKKPYGQPLYNPLFWLIEFKNASLEFWIELLERFGTPWVIAKTEGDKDLLADEIYNMLGGDGAVIDVDDELDIKTAEKTGNFKEIIEYIDNQIRELITGGNLTGQVSGGSHAAAAVHNEIREDIAKADENVVNKLIRQLIVLFKKGNHLDIDIQAKLKDKDDPNKALADRDKIIYDMGYRPKKDYIEKTYNIEVEEIETQTEQVNTHSKKTIAANKLAQDELEHNTSAIDLSKPLTFQEQILDTLNNCSSYDEAFDELSKLYPKIETKDLEELLETNLINSKLLATIEIEEENPNG